MDTNEPQPRTTPPTRIVLSPEEFDALQRRLDEPPQSLPKLAALMALPDYFA